MRTAGLYLTGHLRKGGATANHMKYCQGNKRQCPTAWALTLFLYFSSINQTSGKTNSEGSSSSIYNLKRLRSPFHIWKQKTTFICSLSFSFKPVSTPKKCGRKIRNKNVFEIQAIFEALNNILKLFPAAIYSMHLTSVLCFDIFCNYFSSLIWFSVNNIVQNNSGWQRQLACIR